MKKLFPISVSLIMLLSGLQLTISRHYCGGEFADAKVSVLGRLASCGMENIENDECAIPVNQINPNCCTNKVSSFTVDQNYSPSQTGFNSFAQNVLQVFIIPASITFHSYTAINLGFTDTSPPGNLLANSVSLPKICVFLI
jgi:hypothetical protein